MTFEESFLSVRVIISSGNPCDEMLTFQFYNYIN